MGISRRRFVYLISAEGQMAGLFKESDRELLYMDEQRLMYNWAHTACTDITTRQRQERENGFESHSHKYRKIRAAVNRGPREMSKKQYSLERGERESTARETYRPFGIAAVRWKTWGEREMEWYHQRAEGNREKKRGQISICNVKAEIESSRVSLQDNTSNSPWLWFYWGSGCKGRIFGGLLAGPEHPD